MTTVFYSMNETVEFLYGNRITFEKIEIDDDGETRVFLASKGLDQKCPKCGGDCVRTGTYYTRRVQDFPWFGNHTTLVIRAAKYFCANPDCGTIIFTEQFPFVGPNQKMTHALNLLIMAISVFVGDRTAAFILSLFGVRVSNNTIKNLRKRISLKERFRSKRIGIDEVALRKGRVYLTVIYDLDDHRLIAMLPGRSKQTVMEWLKDHKEIEVVCRDRLSAYSAAIEAILPGCVQIADRFHLLQNLIDFFERKFRETLPEGFYFKDGKAMENPPNTVYAPVFNVPESEIMDLPEYDLTLPVDRDGKPFAVTARKREATESGMKKREAALEVRKLLAETPKKRYVDVQKETGLSYATVKKYEGMTEAEVEELKFGTKKGSRYAQWDNMIYKMIRDGHKGPVILAYIMRRKGFPGKIETLARHISAIADIYFEDRIDCDKYNLVQKSLPAGVKGISRKQALINLFTVSPKTEQNHNPDTIIPQILEENPDLALAKTIFTEFHDALMGDDPNAINAFIDKYNHKGSLVESFVKGLVADLEAVRNAVIHSESSGFVEGNNNKFKLLKRYLYGRSHFENLFQRALLFFYPRDKLKDVLEGL